MIKKILLLSVVISQLTISCTNDEPKTPESEKSLDEQIAEIVKQPYSKLTPSEQKVKLEAEANEMLVQMDKSKSSGAIEALQNLARLLDVSSVDVFSGKNDNSVEDIINTAGVYGIYTWNASKNTWTKIASSTELKFIFPAKESLTTNNATFSTKGTASDVKVKIQDSYNWQTGVEVNDYIFLPTAADAVLTIDNVSAATFTQTAKYANGKEVPNEFAYKMTLNDGYAWEMSGTKATENTSKAAFTFNGKNLVSFNAGSTASIDKLIEDDNLTQYRGKANGLVKIMDNFIIIADMDLVTEAADQIALEKSLPIVDYQKKTYLTDLNAYQLKFSEGNAAIFNKNFKLTLVSKKDGTKIAEVVKRSEKGYSYKYTYDLWIVDNSNTYGGYWDYNPNGGTIIQYYDEELYLKFNDNTEVAMSTYFSEGFEKLETKFEDFIKAFDK
ncbi:hypothetical protein [Flavobacterium sp. RSSB_23]|uniref:hypothetical protein n=1 Tax=Flavobacterium sp. RSSB_23 TaxID=3447668 RepID=UPI003F312CEE